jgi:hypothetical protein
MGLRGAGRWRSLCLIDTLSRGLKHIEDETINAITKQARFSFPVNTANRVGVSPVYFRSTDYAPD